MTDCKNLISVLWRLGGGRVQAGRINTPAGGIYKDGEGRTVAKRKVVGEQYH